MWFIEGILRHKGLTKLLRKEKGEFEVGLWDCLHKSYSSRRSGYSLLVACIKTVSGLSIDQP